MKFEPAKTQSWMQSDGDAIKTRACLYYKPFPVCVELLEAVTDTGFDARSVIILEPFNSYTVVLPQILMVDDSLSHHTALAWYINVMT